MNSKWIEIPLKSSQTGNTNRTVGINEGFDRLFVRYSDNGAYRNGRPLTEIERALAEEVFRLRRLVASPAQGEELP